LPNNGDIALVGDNIREIPHLFKLARKTMNTIIVNLTASVVLDFSAIGLAITGMLNPVVGALVHNVGSVAVIINSSLLLKWRDSK
jgi:cation transport ATPase